MRKRISPIKRTPVVKKVVKRAATKWPQPTARTVRKWQLREMEKRRQGVLPL
jgi:hypothetical protein